MFGRGATRTIIVMRGTASHAATAAPTADRATAAMRSAGRIAANRVSAPVAGPAAGLTANRAAAPVNSGAAGLTANRTVVPVASRAAAPAAAAPATARLAAVHVTTGRTPCASADPELWFAERPAELNLAKALCAHCPIKAACLASALDRREPWGVWGGEIIQDGVVLAYKRGRGRPSNADRRLGLVTRVATDGDLGFTTADRAGTCHPKSA
jgi:WhiB family transcriptional regulator, redox-sensing transcriptional regulator